MKIALIGSTGFTGSLVYEELIARGHSLKCLVRDPSKVARLQDAQIVQGDMGDQVALDEVLSGVDVLVNVASIGFGHGPGIVQAAERAGIKRAVFVSTTSVFTQLNAPSKTIRLQAEKAIAESGLDWVVFRPTMIYGTSRDRNICRLIRFLRKWPAIPVFGTGNYLLQPIYVKDLANVICNAAEVNYGGSQSYNVSGRAPLTYNELIDTVASLLGKKVSKIHFPAKPIISALRLAEKTGLRLPIKAEQVERLNEDKAFDHSEAVRTFRFAPRSFRDGVALEVQELGSK